MKKNIILISLSVIILLVAICLTLWFINREYPDDENTLYSIKFDDFKLRFQRYDYALGQNQLVAVEKSINKGKTYEKLTDELITVSMEPKFIFLTEKLGFAISKPNLTKNNNYMGFKVTNDGGKTFVNATINYNNPNTEILTLTDVPYYENDVLHIKGSIYQSKGNGMGYEDAELTFISLDKGVTWNLEDSYYDNMPVIERLDNMKDILKDKLIQNDYINEEQLESFKVTEMYIDGYYIEDKNKVYAQIEYIYKENSNIKEKIIWVLTDEKEVYDIMRGITLTKSDIDSGKYVRTGEVIK